MALNIEAAKLVNRVVYTTDFKSLQTVKKQMEDLQKGFKNLKPIDTMAAAKSSVTDAKKAGETQAKAFTQGFNQSVKKDINKISTITRPAKSSSGNNSTIGYDADAEYARSQKVLEDYAKMQTMNDIRNRKESSGSSKASKESLDAAKRSEDSYYKELAALAQINNLNGLSNEQKAEAQTKMRGILGSYEEQKLSLKSANSEMQLMLNEYKLLNAEQNKLNASIRREESARVKATEKLKTQGERESANNLRRKEQENYWNRRYAIGMVPGIGSAAFGAWGLGAAAVVGAGYAGVNAIQSSVGRNQDLTQASRQSGYSTATIQAISQSALEHGLENFKVPKIADAIKDMNDKIGDFVNNATLNAKTGKYTGGGGLNDAANILQLSKDDISKFQNDPLGMMNLIVNRGKQLNLSQAQITNVLESFGNDFSRLSYLFNDDGKELTDVMARLNDGGYVLSDAQREQIATLKDFGVALQLSGDSLSDHFTLGVSNAIGGVDGFTTAMKDLNPLMESLGNLVGNTVTEFDGLVKFLDGFTLKNLSQQDWSPSGMYNTANNALNNFLFGGSSPSSAITTPTSDNIFSNSRSDWTSPAGYNNGMQSLVVNPSPVNVVVTPDAQGFSDLIKVTTADQIGDEFKNQTLSMYGTMSSN